MVNYKYCPVYTFPLACNLLLPFRFLLYDFYGIFFIIIINIILQ